MTRPYLTPIGLPAVAVKVIDLPADSYRLARLPDQPVAYCARPRLAPGMVLFALVATLAITAAFPGREAVARRNFDSSEVRLAAAMIDLGPFGVRP